MNNSLETILDEGMGRVLTLIPAKGASTRLKRKNILKLNGYPLIQYPIKLAQAAGISDDVIVSTEDDEIADIAIQLEASVPFKRPSYLSRDPYEVPDVCLHALDECERLGKKYDTMIIMLPTCPLTSMDDFCGSIELFSREKGRFLMTVSRIDPHYYNAMRFGEDKLMMRHVFEDRKNEAKKGYAVRCNGAVTIVDVKAFQEAGTYYGEPLLGYEMPWERSIDIDTEKDLKFAEWLLNRKKDIK